MKEAVLGIIFSEGFENVVVFNRYRDNEIGLPCGKKESGEANLQTFWREMGEECNITPKDISDPVFTMTNHYEDTKCYVYTAQAKPTFSPEIGEGFEEEGSPCFMPLMDLLQTDSKFKSFNDKALRRGLVVGCCSGRDLPHEIHITVSTDDLEKFKKTCKDLKVKPIILDLQYCNSMMKQDVMTSSVIVCKSSEIFDEVDRIVNGLKSSGFCVVREKVESIPNHPLAFISDGYLPLDCYWEAHLAIKMKEDQKPALEDICNAFETHLSRNVFKGKDSDGFFTIMATMRRYTGTPESFGEDLDVFKKNLTEAGFNWEKNILELSIYDTKVSHDMAWIGV